MYEQTRVEFGNEYTTLLLSELERVRHKHMQQR